MLDALNELLWSKVLIFALIALGLVLTLSSRFVQFRYFTRMFRILRHAFHHEAKHHLPGLGAQRGGACRCRQHRRRGGGHHPGWPRGDLLDVGGGPDRHGHQLFRVHARPGLQEGPARRHLSRWSGLLHRTGAGAEMAGRGVLGPAAGDLRPGLQRLAILYGGHLLSGRLWHPHLAHRYCPGTRARPHHFRRHQAHCRGSGVRGAGDGRRLPADGPGGHGPQHHRAARGAAADPEERLRAGAGRRRRHGCGHPDGREARAVLQRGGSR